MAVKYNLTKKRNPQEPTNPLKFYAGAKSTGEVTLRALSKKIVQRCTVNSADVVGVLDALDQVLTEELAESKIVRFGSFGSFQVSIGSKGVEDEKDFHVSMINKKRVVFRPGVGLKEMLNNLTFEKGQSNA